MLSLTSGVSSLGVGQQRFWRRVVYPLTGCGRRVGPLSPPLVLVRHRRSAWRARRRSSGFQLRSRTNAIMLWATPMAGPGARPRHGAMASTSGMAAASAIPTARFVSWVTHFRPTAVAVP
jgi:hypothetical protein